MLLILSLHRTEYRYEESRNNFTNSQLPIGVSDKDNETMGRSMNEREDLNDHYHEYFNEWAQSLN
jgi:hypothetical protein